MMGWYGAGMGGAGGFMWIFMGLFWIALIGLIVWLVIRLLPGSGHQGHAIPGGQVESAEQILDRMLATGEIDEATYRARRGALADMKRPQ